MTPVAAAADRAILQGRRVLVVEDDYLIAMDIVDILRSLDAIPVGPVSRLGDALALVQAKELELELEAAVLDLDLGGQASYAVADALAARAVPFVFVTGFLGEAIAPAYRVYLRVEKPVQPQALAAALIAVV